MPIFTNSSAIWGTLIFLGLIAIYFYKRRSRKVIVSSIMFFAKSKSTAEGGHKFNKLQTPLIFFLEILIFLFIILAIADPMSLHKGQLIPVTIVLDDSISMTAGGDSSPYNLSLRYLKKHIFSQSLFRFTLIKSGNTSQMIGRRDMIAAEAENAIRNWKCDSNSSNLMISLSRSIELGNSDSIIIVLTDHLSDKKLSENIKWVSFGNPLDNMAITSANRSSYGNIDKCLFEFTNFSDKQKDIKAEIIDDSNGEVLEVINGKIGARSSRRAIVKLRNQSSVVKAKIFDDDTVTYDNEVFLMPTKHEKLKVAISFSNKLLADSVKKAVISSDLAIINSKEPQIFIGDNNYNGEAPILSELIISNASQSFYINKSISIDKEHELTSDLPFENAIWVANSNFKKKGKTVMAAGELPLVCVNEEIGNKYSVYFNYDYNKSNLHQTTFWPVFFYNFLEWSMHRQNGPDSFNYRSGSKIEIYSVNDNISSFFIKKESQNTDMKEALVRNRRAVFYAGTPGIYDIYDSDESKTFKIAINLCSYEESDLSNSAKSSELPQILSDENMSHFESVKWWFILLAFVLLIIHQWLISKRRAGYAF